MEVIKSVERIPLIRTNMLCRGDGNTDPIRIVTQWWTDDGDLVAESDSELDRAIDAARLFVKAGKASPEITDAAAIRELLRLAQGQRQEEESGA